MDKVEPLSPNCTQPKSVGSVTTLKYCQYERNLIFCIKKHFQGGVIWGKNKII